jgi:hypothetical protein
MQLINAKVIWDKGTKNIEVVPQDVPETCAQRNLPKSDFACWAWWGEAPANTRMAYMFGWIVSRTVKDGFDPQVIHKAFLQIDEYQDWFENPGILIDD